MNFFLSSFNSSDGSLKKACNCVTCVGEKFGLDFRTQDLEVPIKVLDHCINVHYPPGTLPQASSNYKYLKLTCCVMINNANKYLDGKTTTFLTSSSLIHAVLICLVCTDWGSSNESRSEIETSFFKLYQGGNVKSLWTQLVVSSFSLAVFPSPQWMHITLASTYEKPINANISRLLVTLPFYKVLWDFFISFSSTSIFLTLAKKKKKNKRFGQPHRLSSVWA